MRASGQGLAMPDPSIPEGVSELAKVGAGGAGGSILTLLLGRIFGGQDRVISRLDALQLSVLELAKQVAVMGSAASRRDFDVEQLSGLVAEHSKQLARLEATLEQISEGGVLR